MDDQSILDRIKSLVQEEHELRSTSDGAGPARLQHLEENLDQCWDLLRQRRAKKDSGDNPDTAAVRPVSQVEGYLPRK